MMQLPGKNGNRKDEQPGGPGGGFRPRAMIIWLLIAIAVVAMIQLVGDGSRQDRGSLSEFDALLAEGSVTEIRIEDDVIIAKLDPAGHRADEPGIRKIAIPSDYGGNVLDRVREYNLQRKENGLEEIKYDYARPPWYVGLMQTWLPWLLMLGLIWFLLTRMMRGPGTGGVLAFGKSRARLAKKHVGVTFDDVAGVEEAKAEVREIIEFLRNPAKFERLGGRVPRGVLLVGAPGTGKTLLAKAIAGEADRPFFSISGSDFVEMFVGVGASRVRDLFRQAKENAPCIIFLDEIDAVGRRRGTGLGGGHDEREQTLNAILVEMDGFDSDDRVILIAATNRPDVLDPALLRPGRFDRQIVVDPPDIKGREAILKVHSRKIQLAPDADLGQVARGTAGFSGADLANLINEAAIIAVMKGKKYVETEDMEEARDKVRWGREKKSKAMSKEERRSVAVHEAGHAIVGKLLEPDVDPIHKVGIIPRGMSLGATMYLPREDTYLMRRKKLLGTITTALGGRAAEEMLIGEVTSGVQNDLEAATELARMMVCKWGMTEELGPINYSAGEETLFLGREVTKVRNLSEETAKKIDAAIRKIIDDCNRKAHHLLEEHKDALIKLTEELLEYEVLDGHEVELILEGKPLERPRRKRQTPSPESEGDEQKPAQEGLPEFREGIQPA